jgi:hypothetical protein
LEQVLKIALEARALKVGRVALDGTKINANASKYKAMSYDRMKRRERISVRRSKICWRRRKRGCGGGCGDSCPRPLRYTAAQESDPPGTEHTHAIAVNQQLRHHSRRLATLLAAVHLIHRRKIELIDHVADDIRQMILRQPLLAGSAAAANHMNV